jgi:site-specific recombinase XerD
MKLIEAYDLAFETRDSWREGKASPQARINANHVMRILGPDIEMDTIETKHFAEITKVLKSQKKANATINRVTSSLRTLFTELKQLGHKLHTPDYKHQKESRGRPEFYTEEEIATLLTIAAKRDDHMLLHDSILFAYKTGCRQAEQLELCTAHVDLKNNQFIFLDTKNGDDHYLPIHNDLFPVLERRLNQAIDERIFPWDNSEQLRTGIRQLQAIAGMEGGKLWHTIRHTTATHLVSKGVELRKIMGVLNHRNVNTTLRYAKVANTAKKEALDLL